MSRPTGNFLSSTINISNTILGAGMLAIPNGIAQVGLIQGFLLILVAGLLSNFGLTLLTKCATILNTRNTSFFAVSKFCFKDYGFLGIFAPFLFDLGIAIKCFGVSISYLVIVGELMVKISSSLVPTDHFSQEYVSSTEFWITVAMLLIAPTCFFKRLDALKYTSSFALLAVAYLFIVIVGFAFYWPTGMPEAGWIKWEEIVWWKADYLTLSRVAPIYVFAFTCHQNIFSVYNEIEKQSQTKIVIYLSIFSAIFIYETIGIFGYLTFGSSVSDNIISMYPSGIIITLGQFAIVLLVLLSYPLQCHPCRASLYKVVDGFGKIKKCPCPDQGDEDEPADSNLKFYSLTFGIMISSYLIAVSIKNLSTVLKVVGATGSTTICYILPGLLYYKLCQKVIFDREVSEIEGGKQPTEVSPLVNHNVYYGDDGVEEEEENDSHLKEKEWIGSIENLIVMKLALFLGVFGVAFMVVCLTNICLQSLA